MKARDVLEFLKHKSTNKYHFSSIIMSILVYSKTLFFGMRKFLARMLIAGRTFSQQFFALS